MYRSLSRKRRFGFTLVEVLVTTVVVGTLAAVVIPAMIKLAPAGDPARVASDLGSVKMAIDVVSQSARPRIPGDIEDLINEIGVTDKGLDGTVYTAANVSKWKGPYLQQTMTATTTDDATVVAFKSGGSALIHSALYRCPATGTYNTESSDLPCTIYTGTADDDITDAYVAVKVTGILPAAGTEFKNLNDIIDGTADGSADGTAAGSTVTIKQNFGMLRQNASGTVFFLAAPYTAP